MTLVVRHTVIFLKIDAAKCPLRKHFPPTTHSVKRTIWWHPGQMAVILSAFRQLLMKRNKIKKLYAPWWPSRIRNLILLHSVGMLSNACRWGCAKGGCECVITMAAHNAPWASNQIRKIAGCACAGNAGNVFPCRRFQGNPLVSDPGMHHGTCVTHVPWCMSGSLTCGDGENIPGIPGACAPAILSIWQEAHGPITGKPSQYRREQILWCTHHRRSELRSDYVHEPFCVFMWFHDAHIHTHLWIHHRISDPNAQMANIHKMHELDWKYLRLTMQMYNEIQLSKIHICVPMRNILNTPLSNYPWCWC